MNLLNFDSNTKMLKSKKFGVLTGILHLAPASLSGVNVCPHSSNGCRTACLNTAGHGLYPKNQKIRIAKTKWLFEDKQAFMTELKRELDLAVIRTKKNGFTLAIRLNGTSDLSWESLLSMDKYPNIKFYDYTKNPFRMNRFLSGGMPKNYHLTFSLSESNMPIALQVLKQGGNVAMVFGTKDVTQLPKIHLGYKVISGDENDLRFKDPKNVIVALKMKGKAIYDETGFVQSCGDREAMKQLVNA